MAKLTETIKNLYHLTDVEFRQLDMHISFAKNIRSIQKQFGLTNDAVCYELNIKKSEFKRYINGSVNFSLRDMANIDAMYSKFAILDKQNKIEEYIAKNHITITKT